MKPYVGMPVLVHGRNHNGSVEHPGVITRVWNDAYVNVVIFPDASAPYAVTSVKFMPTPAIGDSVELVVYPCFPPAQLAPEMEEEEEEEDEEENQD